MTKTRNVVKDFRLEVAARKRKCDVSAAHPINAGDRVLAYEEVPGQRKNICMACAPKVLEVAQGHLKSLIDDVT